MVSTGRDDDLSAWTSAESMYTSGDYHDLSQGHADADYKVREVECILRACSSALPRDIRTIADVGCGAGATTHGLRALAERMGWSRTLVTGFDLQPQIARLENTECVRFVRGDFLKQDASFDLIVLFDVIEHVPAPIDFLRAVARKAQWVALHIPLDNSFFSLVRDLNRANLSLPGHLVVLDLPAAINLVTFSGLRPVDYRISPAFGAPSGGLTRGQRILRPLRRALYRVSPYLLQRTLGGVSLTVLARAPISARSTA